MTTRTEIHADGTFNDQTGVGGWAAVVARTSSGRQENTSSYEMELRAMLEAVKLAEGPCTVVSDYDGLVRIAKTGKPPEHCKPLWVGLYAAASGKDVEFAWRKRDQSLGSRLAHQLARDAVRGR